MKKYLFLFSGLIAINCLILMACKKKQDDTITPTYKSEASGTASNPQPNNVTVTGQTPTNNVPTNYTTIDISAAGWSNPSCVTTNSLYLQALNGGTKVTVTFATPPTIGTYTYNVASIPGQLACSVQVENAPEQPEGVLWVGRSGKIKVITNLNSVSAAIIENVVCYQSSGFNFPTVTVKGSLGCY
jgi:hypothetical protein